jgi:hypothetical protein
VTEEASAPVDHPYQKALRILRERLECLDERTMALVEHRPVDLADEKQHLGEMVVIIIDRKDWQLHPYWHFQSLFAAAQTLLGCG